MADIFDQLAQGTSTPSGLDIFDEIAPQPAPPAPKPQERGFMENLGRYANIAARELAPYAAAGTAGAGVGLLGGPFAPVTAPVGFAAGAGAYGLSKILGDLGISGFNAVADTNIPTVSETTDRALDATGLFIQPETAQERILSTTTEGVADAMGGVGLGKTLAQSAAPLAQKIGGWMSATPRVDAALGGVGGAAFGTAREAAPDSPLAQIVAGVGAPLVAGAGLGAMKGAANYLGPNNVSAFLAGGADDVTRQIMATGVEGVNDGAGRVAKRMFGILPSREAAAMQKASDDAAMMLQSAAKQSGGVDQAIASLDSASELATPPQGGSPGYRPTSGTASENMGLIGLEKGVASEPAIVGRYAANKQAIANETSQQLQPVGAPPRVAQNFIGQELNQGVSQAKAAKNAAEQSAQQAARDFELRKADIADAASESNRTQPSTQIRESLQAQREAVKQQVDEVFAEVPQDVIVDVNPTARQKALEIAKQYQGVVGGAPAAIVDFLKLTKKGGQITSGAAQKNLQELYAAAANAPEGSNTARLIGELRDSLDADISEVEEFSGPLREARNFYRDNFVPKYKSGEAFNVLYRRGAGGAPVVAPSETVGRFMNNPEDVEQLVSGLSGTSGNLSAADESALEGWVVSNMSNKVKSMPTEDRVMAFVRENDAKLAAMPPRIKNRVMEIAKGLGSAEKAAASAKGDLAVKQSAFDAATDAATNSSLAKFAKSKEPSYEVDSWLYGKDARARMNELVQRAKRDKTGKSLEGVKNAIKESLERKIKNPGASTASGNEIKPGGVEDWATSFAKASKLLADDSPTRKAMRQIFDREELQNLDRIRKQIEVSARINIKATAGSDTASLQQNKSQIQEMAEAVSGRGTRTNVPGAVQLRTINTILETAKAVAQSSVIKGNQQELYREIMLKAMLEPEIAKALLRKPTPENLKKTSILIRPLIRAIMLDRGNTEDESQQQVDRTGKADLQPPAE